jgi:hypothetical protein
MTTVPAPLTEDLQAELAARAARAQRANEPRALVLLGALLATVALLLLSLAWTSYRGATEAAQNARERADLAAEKAAHLRALAQVAEGSGSDPGQAAINFRTLIDRAGVEAGLRDPLRPASETSAFVDRAKGTRQLQLTYDLRDPSLGALVQFMQRAAADVPGLEVHSVLLRPEAQVWYLQVKFARWERLEGT